MGKSKKKAPVKPEPESEVDSEEEEEIFHVEVISKARVVPLSDGDETDFEEDGFGRKRVKGGKWEYFVKWADYASDENTWEPEENVAGCERLLRSFWTDVGYDNNDYGPGTVLEADEKWIKQQKKYSKKQIKADKEELRKRKRKAKKEKEEKEREEKEREKGKEKKKDKERESPVASSSKAKEKLASESSLPPKIKRKRPETESSDDEPLATRSSKIEKPLKQKRKVSVEGPSTATGTPVRTQSSEPKSHTPLFSDDESDTGHGKGKGKAKAPAGPAPAQKAQPMRPMRLPHLKRNNTGPSNPYIAASSAPPVRINPSSSPPSTPTAPTSTPAPAPALPGISTKQRLGALAMEAVPTKVVKKYNQPKTDLRTLQSLKMKKTSNIPQTDNPQKEASGSNIKKVLQPLPAPQLDDFFEDMPYTDEPMSMAPPVDPPPRGTQQLPSRKNSLLQSPKSAQTEVDKFLQSVMPSSMAGPLMPAPERPQEVQPPKSLIAPAAKPQLPTRIPKKYKWNGQFNYESGGTIKSLCNVALSDCTDPPVQGMRFKIALDPMTELELTSFHDAADLGPILQACKPAEQLARLDPQDDVDTEPLKTFARYMGRMQKVGLIPLELDNIVVAHMVLFSPSLKNLLGQFNVPVELSTNATLIAALVPWTLSRVQIEQEWRRPLASLVASKPPKLEYQAFMERTRWDKSTRTKPADQQALRLLKPSKMWHDYMSSSTERPWSTWDGVDRGPNPTTTFPKVEYNLLASLLSHYAKPSDNWRVLFIHIGALSTVHLCRHFVEKRARRSDCALFTYGTHHRFPPEEWGIKEIYNCGGVVTFAPHVLMRDPVGIAELINEVDEHPLWLGYILPSAIGMAARLLYPDEQPQQMLARPEFALRPILNAIEEGKISLISRPPDLVHSSETERAGWISKYFWQQPSDALDMLEVCLSAFTSKYSNAPRNRWVLDFEGEITEDLLAMQLQPALMRQYRRYVVVADDHKVNPMDRVEWSYLSSFTFGDDFSLKFAPPEIA